MARMPGDIAKEALTKPLGDGIASNVEVFDLSEHVYRPIEAQDCETLAEAY